MLVVYGVSLLSNIAFIFLSIAGCLGILAGAMWARYGEAYSSEKEEFLSDAKKLTYWKTALLLVGLSALVPSERTMQYMAGAYLIQSVYESTEAREIGAASKKAVMSQLEVWSKGNEQLLTLIEQIKPAVQEKVHDYSTIGAQQ